MEVLFLGIHPFQREPNKSASVHTHVFANRITASNILIFTESPRAERNDNTAVNKLDTNGYHDEIQTTKI